MAKKKLTTKILSRKVAYDFKNLGKFKMEELELEVDNHGGGSRRLTRVNFDRGHAVSVLAYDPKRDEVLQIKEARSGMIAVGDDTFSDDADTTVAGMIEKGQTAKQAGRREFSEEAGKSAGMALKNVRLIHPGAYVSPGGTSERIALVFGTVDMTKVGGVFGKSAEGEDIKTSIVSADKFIERAEKGKIKDLKTLTFAFWLALHRKEIQEKKNAA